VTLLSDAPARGSVATAPASAPRLVRIGVGVVVAVGIALFFYTRSDMWLDEALTVNIARLPLHDLRTALVHDGAPPLYYVLLHVWTGVLGDGDIAARSLSGLFAVGTLVVSWFAARRWFDTNVAWLTVVAMAANPFMIRYATEARMYTLEMLLIACGLVVVPRALEQPTFARLAPVTIVTAALVYTQYWTFYLVGVVVVALALVAWLDRTHRRPALLTLAAIGTGILLFLPWLPTFLTQRAHTGTPWGTPILPGVPLGMTALAFAGGEEQEGWVLLLVLLPLLLLGIFARTVDGRRLELDLHVQPSTRWLAGIGGATLAVSLVLNYAAGQAFAPRYSALVFPFFALLVGRALTLFAERWVQVVVVAVVVALGFVGGLRSTIEQRTQAGQVAAVLRADARADDLVVYCPDQLGPAVHRLGPGGLTEVTYPSFRAPAIVDWTDYQEHLDATDPAAFAAEALRRAGDHTIWLVTGPGYDNLHGACEQMSAVLGASRPLAQRVVPNDDYFEQPGLQQFSVSAR
jgi:uncharacterized membrane protein